MCTKRGGKHVCQILVLVIQGGRANHLTLIVYYSPPREQNGTKLLGDLLIGDTCILEI